MLQIYTSYSKFGAINTVFLSPLKKKERYPNVHCGGAIVNNRADIVLFGLRLLYFLNVHAFRARHKSVVYLWGTFF